MKRNFWVALSSICLSLSLILGILSASLTTASTAYTPGAAFEPAGSATKTPTPTVTPTSTRRVPTIRLKLPPDGTVDDNGAVQLDASVVDPNYTADGMRAMAFEVRVRVADPNKKGAKTNSVEFVVYASEEDFQNQENPIYQHTEANAPFCMFRDTNNRCNKVNVERNKSWPQSDDTNIEPTRFLDGDYILDLRVQAGEDSEMFWHSAIDFSLATTASSTQQPTRPTPTIRLKLPPDGTVDDNGATQLDASIVDPNYTLDGMRAMAFQVQVRVADPNKQGAKINRVEFVVYASEEDFQNQVNPIYQHVEANAPFCMFRDTNNRCNKVNVERNKFWPQSDDEAIEQVRFRDGDYILDVRVQAGEENEMFWHSAVDFVLKTQR